MTSLIPVLELTAGTYSTKERELPAGSAFENPAGWAEYWTDSLADAGITGLVETRAGSSLVTLSQLTPDVLRAILRSELAEATWVRDELGPLAGGYVFQAGAISIPPGCCGDLGNLYDWRAAAEYTGEDWQMLWIGHPWTHVRATGSGLHLAEPNERTPTEGLIEAVSIRREDLLAAIAVASEQLTHFAAMLTPLVDELRPTIPARDVVGVLLYGHSSERAVV